LRDVKLAWRLVDLNGLLVEDLAVALRGVTVSDGWTDGRPHTPAPTFRQDDDQAGGNDDSRPDEDSHRWHIPPHQEA
jgi:hypothetical protein